MNDSWSRSRLSDVRDTCRVAALRGLLLSRQAHGRPHLGKGGSAFGSAVRRSLEKDAKRCFSRTAPGEEINRLVHIGIRADREGIEGFETAVDQLRDASPAQTPACLDHFELLELFRGHGRSRHMLGADRPETRVAAIGRRKAETPVHWGRWVTKKVFRQRGDVLSLPPASYLSIGSECR